MCNCSQCPPRAGARATAQPESPKKFDIAPYEDELMMVFCNYAIAIRDIVEVIGQTDDRRGVSDVIALINEQQENLSRIASALTTAYELRQQMTKALTELDEALQETLGPKE